MSIPRPHEILLRVGGKCLARHGVLAMGGAYRRPLEEVAETVVRAAPARIYLDRDGIYRDAAANIPRLHYPPGLVDQFGAPIGGLLAEHGRLNRIENGDYETDAVGSAATGGSSIARDATNVRHGSWALKVTTANAADSGVLYTKRDGSRMAATAARLHSKIVWVYAPAASVGKTLRLAFEWYDAGAGIISTSNGSNVALVAGWNRLIHTALAPALTVTVRTFIETNAAQGVFDFWVDLADFSESPYPIEPTPTNTGAVTPVSDDITVPIQLGLDIDFTIFLWTLPQHGNVASWSDGDSLELDPFGFGLDTPTETDTNRTLRLHRQNSASTWEWEWGSNTPTASRSFTPSPNPIKLLLRHRASDHVLEASVDGGDFAAAGVPAAGINYIPLTQLRLGNHPFSARAGNWTILDFILARGLRSFADMNVIP